VIENIKTSEVGDVPAQRLLLCICLLMLTSCRLVITTDATGHIRSSSGQFDCDQTSCAFNITEEVSEEFRAVPAEGYRFAYWRGLCKRAPTEVCTARVFPLPEKFRQHDGDIFLQAVFEPNTDPKAWYRDQDGDQYGAANLSRMGYERPEGYVGNRDDCDDSDDSVRPWAKELSDGRDNDCDGEVDEGFADQRFYLDHDGDGFGDPNFSRLSSERPAGHVDNALDCNDAERADHPEAKEVFDGRDNDCDGDVDEGFTVREYFRDVDGDGYGDASDVVSDVNPPQGYVSNGSDNCVETANPGQSDLDGDGIGDACDPVDDRNTGSGDDSLKDAIAGVCDPTAEELAMLDAVNAFRAQPRECGSRGSFPAVPALTWRCELQSAALAHSMDMADNNFFSHTGSDGQSAGDRITNAGYSWSAWGENIAAGIPLSGVSAVMQAWIDSPGHCSNLMGANFTNFGAAKYSNTSSLYDVYWTQVFGRPR
jgi:uncharacterized protein YkwD